MVKGWEEIRGLLLSNIFFTTKHFSYSIVNCSTMTQTWTFPLPIPCLFDTLSVLSNELEHCIK